MKHQFNFQAFKKSLKKSQALANFAFMSFTLTAGAADAMDDLQSDKAARTCSCAPTKPR